MVIDEDLGLSGTSVDRREGFKRVMTLIAQGLVGIVLCSDTSRLTRSSGDFEAILALCRVNDALLAIEGLIADLNDPANRLLARLRANVAEYENELRAETFEKAKRMRARQGYAVSRPPTGYVVTTKGKWAKDSDQTVRLAIEEVFRQYRVLGSARQIVPFFAHHNLDFPTRTPAGELLPARPNFSRIIFTLKNPAFAGFLVYGRSRSLPGPGNRRRLTGPEERILVPDHHEGYITPAEWHSIQERLRANSFHVSQPPGHGAALCQGIMWCGRCGRRMQTVYYPTRHAGIGIRYQCTIGRSEYGEPLCWSIPGRTLDAALAQELLKNLTPANIEAVIEAAGEVNQGYEADRQQREQELIVARYQVQLTKRRYQQVDPENRRLAVNLEAEYEKALERMEQIELRHQLEPLTPLLEVTQEVIEAIRGLAQDVPSLWSALTTSPQDRKALFRLFVTQVRLVSVSDTDFEVEVAWQGGAISAHRMLRPGTAGIIVIQLAARGLHAKAIANELNSRGFRTLKGQGPYTVEGVQSLMHYHRVGKKRRRLGGPKADS